MRESAVTIVGDGVRLGGTVWAPDDAPDVGSGMPGVVLVGGSGPADRSVAAAVATLRSTPGVDAERVGVFGHSEGGWVVLRASAAFFPHSVAG